MFSVYGVTGRLFKGAMEELRQVTAVGAVMRARGLEPVGRADVPPARAPQAPLVGAAASKPLAAYAQAGASPAVRHPLRRVADVMQRRVITVPMDMPVLQAWQLLGTEGVGQAPVLDLDGELVGLLTRADLLQAERLPLAGANSVVWRAWLTQPVAEIMWTPVPAVGEETDLRRLARVLLDTHLPGLPVVDEERGRLQGFVSRTDILQAVVHDPPIDLWS